MINENKQTRNNISSEDFPYGIPMNVPIGDRMIDKMMFNGKRYNETAIIIAKILDRKDKSNVN